jgi:peptidoglycan/xylan/chitin deacetylase (PgdA/CDA1 family)
MKDYTSFLKEEEFVIYLFHGVITKNKHSVRNYNQKHLEVKEFEKMISALRASGKPVHMDDIVFAHQKKKSLPPYSYAITFDDGFANNFHIAAPLLKKYETPAIFYLTSGFIKDNSCSWTDIIERAVENLKNVKLEHEFLSTQSPIKSIEDKIAFLEQVRDTVKNNSSIDPYQFAQSVIIQNKAESITQDTELDQKMTPDEVRQLSDEPLFTIGAHSHTHRIMSFLNSEDLDNEIYYSINLLKQWTGKKINHYSYPEGLKHCFSEKVINCLKKHGIECCPTALSGLNKINTDLFKLKRISVV